MEGRSNSPISTMPPLNEESRLHDDTSTSSNNLRAAKQGEGTGLVPSNEQQLLRTIAELKSEVCRMQVRNEELEQDRNYNAIKATELQMSIEAFKTDDVHDALLTKSMQLAEAMTDVDLLKVKLRKLETEQQHATKEREKLSNVVRTLQNVSSGADDDDEDDEVVLTAERALEMALKNMKYQIEVLEEERQRLASLCASQKKELDSQKHQVDTLQKENHLASLRVAMLTQLIRDSSENETKQVSAKSETKDTTKNSTPQKDIKKEGPPPEIFKSLEDSNSSIGEYMVAVKDDDDSAEGKNGSWVADERRKRVDALRAWKSGKKQGHNKPLSSFISHDSDGDGKSVVTSSKSATGVEGIGEPKRRRARASRSGSRRNVMELLDQSSGGEKSSEGKQSSSPRRPRMSRRSMSNPDLLGAADNENGNEEQPKRESRRSSRGRPSLSKRSMSNPNLLVADEGENNTEEQPKRQSRRSARRSAAAGEGEKSPPRPRLSRRSRSNPNLLS